MKKNVTFLLAIFLLTACSALRENTRLVADFSTVSPGHNRQEIEKTLGSPESADDLPDGATMAIYTTSRVDERTKDSLVKSRLGVDAFTLGLGEIVSPFGMFDADQTKIYKIFYSPDGIANRIYKSCKYYYPAMIIEIKESSPYSGACGGVLQG